MPNAFCTSGDGCCAATETARTTAATISLRLMPVVLAASTAVRYHVLALEQLAQRRVTASTHRQPRSVTKNRHAAVLRVQLDLVDALDVQKVRPVDADEARSEERRVGK